MNICAVRRSPENLNPNICSIERATAKNFLKKFKKSVDKYEKLCYNRYIKERKKEVKKMICDNCKNRTNCELVPYSDECDKSRNTSEKLFIVDTDNFADYAEFTTYREAEIYCGERGISAENIYQEEE